MDPDYCVLLSVDKASNSNGKNIKNNTRSGTLLLVVIVVPIIVALAIIAALIVCYGDR
jgi:hypothetical protein